MEVFLALITTCRFKKIGILRITTTKTSYKTVKIKKIIVNAMWLWDLTTYLHFKSLCIKRVSGPEGPKYADYVKVHFCVRWYFTGSYWSRMCNLYISEIMIFVMWLLTCPLCIQYCLCLSLAYPTGFPQSVYIQGSTLCHKKPRLLPSQFTIHNYASIQFCKLCSW
jgi:hypothetical protein